MLRYISLLAATLSLSISFAQQHPPIRGYVTDTNKEPLIGASLHWENTTLGAVTNENGYFEINEHAKSSNLVVRYVGYKTDTVHVDHTHEPITIVMSGEATIDEVVVRGQAVGTLTSRSAAIQTQTINFAELCRAACCNLGESFETNPSVDVSYSDAVTGARQIQLLGLSGRYVQMLTENLPNFRGASSTYGLNFVPGAWMESIQVSKGTSSVKNGYEALTGQINVEYKKPKTADPLSINLFASNARRMEANVDGQYEFNENIGGSLFLHYSNDTQKHDANKDGFLDQPLTEQFNLINRWYFNAGKYAGQVGVKYLQESRENGQWDVNQQLTDPYSIGINTLRAEVFTKQALILNPETGRSLALMGNFSIHDQKSTYGQRKYDVQQNNLYLSLLYENEFTVKHGLSAGVSLNVDQTNDVLSTNSLLQHELNRNEAIYGAYAQYTFKPIEKLTFLAGIRADHHNDYGGFITPRLHIKYNILDDHLHFRASIGKGFRSVNIFAENNYLFASNRNHIILEPIKMEEAVNYGANLTGYIPIAEKQLTVTGEWYYTKFINQLVTDMDANAHEVRYYNLDGRSYASSAQIEASYPFFRGFTLTAAYRLTDTKMTYGGELREKPLTNRSKGLVTASYQTPLQKWQFDFTTQFNGGGRLPDPDPLKPLWNKEFPSYALMNAQVTRYFRTWSVYLGCENIANYKMDHPIIDPSNPYGDNFDATMVWGPVHGRKFYIGLRWSIPRKD